MLSRKQRHKLEIMVFYYRQGMLKTSKKDIRLIDAWVKRYEIAMERVLQKQGKR